MIRMFYTHVIRKQTELSDCLWEFSPKQGKQLEKRRDVYVPGCWENIPGFGNYRGEVLYSRTFSAEGNIRLEFKGISHTAVIYLDGEKIAEHYGAYTPFSVVKRNIKKGDHKLDILVDNRFGEDSALHIPNDYMTYGGISRPVVLEQLDSAYIKWAHFTPYRMDGKWHCDVRICICGVENRDEILEVTTDWNGVQIPIGNCRPHMGEDIILNGTFTAEQVEEWMPETPKLYPIKAQLHRAGSIIDDFIDRIGFREISLQGRKILINGKAIRIKGVCRHEDYEGFGCALPAAAIQKDLQIIRDLGANSIRTSHYPNDERFLDLCDEQGILVWEENHARGLTEEHMHNKNFEIQCETCNREMILSHYNHPCIYIWGILNECASQTEYGRTCYKKQFTQIRKLDATRPLTFASCQLTHNSDGSKLKLTDICMDLPDVVSFNIYPKWYFDADVSQFLEDLHACIEKTPGAAKPMLISEIGAGAEYNFHSPEHLKWSEEYQEDALKEQLESIFQDKYCCGVYIWQFCDIRVSTEWFACRPRSHNNKGIVDGYRRPKSAYQTVKTLFQSYPNYFEPTFD